MGPVATAIITVIGTVSCLSLALWFWRRGQTGVQAHEVAPTNPNREGDTTFIPRDQLLPQPRGQDGTTEFVDRQEAFRIADRARAQAASAPQVREVGSPPSGGPGPASTEYIPREELLERIAAPRRD